MGLIIKLSLPVQKLITFKGNSYAKSGYCSCTTSSAVPIRKILHALGRWTGCQFACAINLVNSIRSSQIYGHRTDRVGRLLQRKMPAAFLLRTTRRVEKDHGVPSEVGKTARAV